MDKALAGVKVLDLTQSRPAPRAPRCWHGWRGRDQGRAAENGEQGRWMLTENGVDSHYFMLLNANKRSITLNMKSERGKQMFVELINRLTCCRRITRWARSRAGIGYDRLREINPRLIYLTIKGFGTYGRIASTRAST